MESEPIDNRTYSADKEIMLVICAYCFCTDSVNIWFSTFQSDQPLQSFIKGRKKHYFKGKKALISFKDNCEL